MSKHTPGKWMIDPLNRISIISKNQYDRNNNDWHALICQANGNRGREEDDANARLIAAAPDLLEALGACLEYMDTCHPGDHRKMLAYHLTTKVLAKVEGR